MQLQGHDDFFGPRRRRLPWKSLFSLIPFLPSLAILITPSFQLGKIANVTPSFETPGSIAAGALFTVSTSDEAIHLQADGKPLKQLLRANRSFLGAAPKTANSVYLSFVYRGPEHPWKPELLLPKFEHPTARMFWTRVKLEAPPTAPTESEDRQPASTPNFRFNDLIPIPREDGAPNVYCWNEPKVLPVEVRRYGRLTKLGAGLVAVTPAAPGEVAFSGSLSSSEKGVILYHGGGLYSSYSNLQELKVAKGDRVEEGQTLGTMPTSVNRGPASDLKAQWSVRLGSTEIHPQMALDLSKQLCGSK